MSLRDEFRARAEAYARREAQFPNSVGLSRYWREGRAFSERLTRSEKKSFFSEFGDYFTSAARLLVGARVDVAFRRFGISSPARARSAANAEFGRTNCLLATSDSGRQIAFLFPTRTALILLLAQMGYELDAFCRDKTIWRDFESTTGKDSYLTAIEREVFARLRRRFCDLAPAITLPEKIYQDFHSDEEWRVDFLADDYERVARILGNDDYYYEERALIVAKREFPWTTLYPANDLFETRREPNDERPNPKERRESTESEPIASPPASVPRPTQKNSSDNSGAKQRIDVVIARGKMPCAAWQALKPGDVITTDEPADKLFEGVLNGQTVFRGRPGLYRGAHAIQIEELDGARDE